MMQVHDHHELLVGLHGDAGELLRQPGRLVPREAHRNGDGKLRSGHPRKQGMSRGVCLEVDYRSVSIFLLIQRERGGGWAFRLGFGRALLPG